jgi:putative Holliday junction resolvase
MSCLVGVDVGDVRIGLSVSDGEKKIAFPLGSIGRVGNSYGFNKIAKLLSGRDVEGFVVGLPVRTDGTLGAQAEKVLIYIDEMKKYFNVRVISWDERFSTAMAEHYLENRSMRAKNQKRVVDEIAAQIILQSYLDNLNRPQRE